MKVWLKILTSVMSIFTSEFWDNLKIYDIKENPDPTSQGFVLAPGEAGKDLAYNTLVPGLSACVEIFTWIGIFICVLMLLIGLVRAMLPQDIDPDVEHPVRVVTRFAVSFFAVGWSYNILAIITNPLAAMFEYVSELGSGKFEVGKSVFKQGIAPGNGEEGIEQYYDFDVFEDNDLARGGALYDAYGVPNPGSDEIGSVTVLIKDADMSDIGMFALCLILMTMMCLAYIRLVLELVERWVTLVFLIYASPLAMSTLSSAGTMNVFKSYMKMVFSEYLLIIFNYLFVFIFSASYANQFMKTAKGGAPPEYIFESITQAALFFAVMTALCKLGQRLDEHLNSLGVSAARTGAGMGGELWGAVGMTFGTAMTAGRLTAKGLRGTRSLGEKAGKAGAAIKSASDGKKAAAAGIAGAGSFGSAFKDGSGRPVASNLDKANQMGFNTKGVDAVGFGTVGGHEAVTMQTPNGTLTGYQVDPGQTQNVAGITMQGAGKTFFAPLSDTPDKPAASMLQDEYVQQQLSSGGFGKGYEHAGYVVGAGTAAEIIRDGNGGYSLAVNQSMYDAGSSNSIKANNGGSWRQVDLGLAPNATLADAQAKAGEWTEANRRPFLTPKKTK